MTGNVGLAEASRGLATVDGLVLVLASRMTGCSVATTTGGLPRPLPRPTGRGGTTVGAGQGTEGLVALSSS